MRGEGGSFLKKKYSQFFRSFFFCFQKILCRRIYVWGYRNNFSSARPGGASPPHYTLCPAGLFCSRSIFPKCSALAEVQEMTRLSPQGSKSSRFASGGLIGADVGGNSQSCNSFLPYRNSPTAK